MLLIVSVYVDVYDIFTSDNTTIELLHREVYKIN